MLPTSPGGASDERALLRVLLLIPSKVREFIAIPKIT
jgi:hypothetical protein